MRVAGVVSAVLLAWAAVAPAEEPPRFTPEEVRAAVEQHVQRKVSEDRGVYRLVDGRTGERVDLEFLHVGVVGAAEVWQVHDRSQAKPAHGWAACVRFHPVGTPAERVFDVDVAVEPRGDTLEVTDVHIHKVTQLENGKWVWKERPPLAQAR